MEILIVIGLIILNGIFSMSEIAIISARKSYLTAEAKQGNTSAKSALDLANQPDRFLSTIQIGITLIGILTGIYSGDVLAGDFNTLLITIGVPQSISYSVAQISIVIVVTYLTLIFGELVPKRIGLSIAEKVAKIVARPMNALSIIASPFVWLLAKSTNLIFNLFHIKENTAKVTEDEIRTMVKEGTDDGEVKEVEQDIVERVFSLGDRDVESIMTFRTDITWLDTDMTNEEMLAAIQKNFYEVYPVASKSLDNILGIAYVKELFGKIDKDGFHIENNLHTPLYFHENMEVYKALEQMKVKQVQFALVCDEFGSIQGIITMKDILEALVGALPDATEEPEIIQRQDGSWLVDGQCPFYDFLDYFGLEDLYPQYEYNTVSGLILEILEHIPHTGEKIAWKNFVFEVVDMDGARIDKVLTTTISEEEELID